MTSFNEHQLVIGMSGSGKSRLAVEMLAEIENVVLAEGDDHLLDDGAADTCDKNDVEDQEPKIKAPRPYTRADATKKNRCSHGAEI